MSEHDERYEKTLVVLAELNDKTIDEVRQEVETTFGQGSTPECLTSEEFDAYPMLSRERVEHAKGCEFCEVGAFLSISLYLLKRMRPRVNS